MLDTMYMVIHFWCFLILYFACRSILVSIDIAVFLFEIASPIRNSEFGFFSLPLLYGAKINELILVGEWWRLVTPMFLVQDWQWGSCSHSVTISALHLANSVKSVRYNSLRIDILVVVGLEADHSLKFMLLSFVFHLSEQNNSHHQSWKFIVSIGTRIVYNPCALFVAENYSQ